MTFISYAQNFEDVMLWRALKDVEGGFYIDVGAAWPDSDSVTKAFYDRGWRGINVEPNPDLYERLIAERPDDTNLQLAAGDCDGTVVMNFLSNEGLSTVEDVIAENHHAMGWALTRRNVPIRTLDSIWSNYVSTCQPVHFLKIDVEGHEEAVLQGNNWTVNRPWIVVVESTLPMSQEESHEQWEAILLDSNYLFAYADGLNRFYVASEKSHLVDFFKYPPNFFDYFKLAGQVRAEKLAQEAGDRAVKAEADAAKLALKIDEIYASTSWRITRPLRALKSVFSRIHQK